MTSEKTKLYNYLQENYSSKKLEFGCEVEYVIRKYTSNPEKRKGIYVGYSEVSGKEMVWDGDKRFPDDITFILGAPPTIAELLRALGDIYCNGERWKIAVDGNGQLYRDWGEWREEEAMPVILSLTTPKVSDWSEDLCKQLNQLLGI